jgi:MFS family permease
MIMESWINEKSTNKDRGFMLSAYMVVAMSGTIVGPYIVSYGDVGTSGLFIVSALLFSAAIFPVALSAAPSPSLPTDTSFDLRGLWLRSPVAFVGTLVAGIIAAAWLNFAPAYARLTGLDATGGANLIAAVTIGSILSQFPLGRLSDVMDRRIVMIMCGVVGIAACLWMAMVDASHPAFLYLSAFAAGTVIYPIYTLNVAHANDVAPKGQFVRISSGLSVLYGVGVIIGPLVTGPAISYAGPSGLPLLLAACFAVYAGFAGWRIFRRPV